MESSSKKTGRSRLIAISLVIILAIVIIGIYFWSSAQNTKVATTFDVQFTLKEVTDNSSLYYHRYGQWYDTWNIDITKLTDATLRNVDVWTYNGGPSPEIVAHYDYLSTKFIRVQALRIKNQTVTVDIYWEGGSEGFYCNPWE